MDKRVLVVEAHPDDVEWYAGGTIACLTRQGCAITLVICTEGERGSYDSAASPVILAATRKQEQRAAADFLGIGEIVYLGYPDGQLEPTMELRRELAVLYRRFKPDLLLTFDPWKRYELHPDHLAAGRAALDARIVSKMPLFYTHTRALGYDAWAIPEIWLYNADQPNHYVDVGETLAVRLEALRLHASQNVYGDDSVQYLTRQAEEAGVRAGCRYAEAFHRIVVEGAIARSQGDGSIGKEQSF